MYIDGKISNVVFLVYKVPFVDVLTEYCFEAVDNSVVTLLVGVEHSGIPTHVNKTFKLNNHRFIWKIVDNSILVMVNSLGGMFPV